MMKSTCLLTALILGLMLIISPACLRPARETLPREEPTPAAEAVPVWKFFHAASAEGLDTAVVTCYTTDCETGLVPEEITEEEAAAMRRLAVNGVVTEKANDMAVTGGTWVYSFDTPDGRHLMSIEMYQGLMVGRDGMYSYQE